MPVTFAAAYALTMSGMAIQTHKIEPHQMKCLAEAVYFEAGNQTYQGKQAVANVILNRAKVSKKPVCKVIRKKHQFSYFKMSAYKKQSINLTNPKVKVAILNSITVAYAAARGKLKDNTKGARFYMNPVAATDFSWRNKFIQVAVIGDHYFYIDPKQKEITS